MPRPDSRGPYTIVVGLDASPRAEAVLDAAVDLAHVRHGKLVLLRIVGVPVELPDEALSMPPTDLPIRLQELAELDLTHLTKDVPAELLAERFVRVGIAWSTIVDEAKQRHADLIVIGSHGYYGLDRLLGTTAAKVVNHAPCSTLVVR